MMTGIMRASSTVFCHEIKITSFLKAFQKPCKLEQQILQYQPYCVLARMMKTLEAVLVKNHQGIVVLVAVKTL